MLATNSEDGVEFEIKRKLTSDLKESISGNRLLLLDFAAFLPLICDEFINQAWLFLWPSESYLALFELELDSFVSLLIILIIIPN